MQHDLASAAGDIVRTSGRDQSGAITYDPLDRLSNRTLGESVANYPCDGYQLIGEYSSAGALVRCYVRAPGIDKPLVIYDGTGAATKTWQADK